MKNIHQKKEKKNLMGGEREAVKGIAPKTLLSVRHINFSFSLF